MFTCDIVFFLNFDTSVIDDFQDQHFPFGAELEPHIKLLRQRQRVPREVLIACLESIVSDWTPFDVHLAGIDKSHPEGWLLLQVREGNQKIGALQSAMLRCLKEEGYENTGEIPDPSVVLGFFARDQVGRNMAYDQALRMGLSYRTVLDRVDLVIFTSGKRRPVEQLEFKLGRSP